MGAPVLGRREMEDDFSKETFESAMDVLEGGVKWCDEHDTTPSVEFVMGMAKRLKEAHERTVEQLEAQCNECVQEDGWMKLPTDPKGVPIMIGDKLHVRYQRQPKEVAGVGYIDGEPFVVWMDEYLSGNRGLCLKDGGGGWDRVLTAVTMHEQDSWEAIERDARKWSSLHSTPSLTWLIDRCQKLAEEEG